MVRFSRPALVAKEIMDIETLPPAAQNSAFRGTRLDTLGAQRIRIHVELKAKYKKSINFLGVHSGICTNFAALW
jgi:hypothetical protein